MRQQITALLLSAVCLCATPVAADSAHQHPFGSNEASYAAKGSSMHRTPSLQGHFAHATPDSPFDDLLRIEVPDAVVEDYPEHTIVDIVAAQNGRHVVLSHPSFPEMSVRVKQIGKKTKTVSEMREVSHGSSLSAPSLNNSDPDAFCDPTVTSWSGYVDTIDGKSLFFYFFESRDQPEKDPVIMWTNGGPGCSSSLGLFMELGPCLVPENGGKLRNGPPINGTKWNPYGWNAHANIFFLDQPVDVGYSYSRYGVHSYDSDKGAKDVYTFLRIFFAAFKQFRDNDFIMTGESYGGRYIPRYASEVADRNYEVEMKALREQKPVDKSQLINLKKIAVGNGLTDNAAQIPEYYDFMCTRRGGVEPVLSIETCKRLVSWKHRCARWLQKECRDTYDVDMCSVATDACDGEMTNAYFSTGRNPYNINDLCLAGYSPNLCYSITADIRAYLDRSDVRKLVGAEPVAEIGKFASCNEEVAAGFNSAHDISVNSADYVAALLERGIDVLIYVGKLDWICNWLGNQAWVDRLKWTDGKSFHEDKLRSWNVDGQEAGMTRRGGGLTWATVEGAGHMVPYDKPKVALAMLRRFLLGEKL